MSIDPHEVTAVLLADGWHQIDKGSFQLEPYEYGDLTEEGEEIVRLSAGRESLITAVGARFAETFEGGRKVRIIHCPLTSILAVRTEA